MGSVDRTLDSRRQLRGLERQLEALADDARALTLARESPEDREARLRAALVERAAAAEAKYLPFSHLFARHLRERVLLAIAAVGDNPDPRLLWTALMQALDLPPERWDDVSREAAALRQSVDLR
jgi:hypothetical protein